MRHRIALAVPLLALAACSRAARPEGAIRVQATHPERLNLVTVDAPTVRVEVDGRADLLFLVDSGAAVSLIDRARARELGLDVRPYAHPGTTRGANGEVVEFDSYVDIDRLEMGSVRVERLRVPVLELEVARHHGWTGVLGQDVLSLMPVVLDAQRGHLHLLPPDCERPAIEQYLGEQDLGRGAWVVVEAPFRPSPMLPLQVTVAPGSELEFEIEVDTGATGTSLPKAAIEALALAPAGSFESRTVSGPFVGRTYELEGLSLFGLRVSAQVQESALEFGLLGMDVLGELVLVLDGPGKRIWLHRRPSAEDGRDPGSASGRVPRGDGYAPDAGPGPR